VFEGRAKGKVRVKREWQRTMWKKQLYIVNDGRSFKLTISLRVMVEVERGFGGGMKMKDWRENKLKTLVILLRS
jgi:ribosomal protein L28